MGSPNPLADVLDLLPLRPLDLGRLSAVCHALRDIIGSPHAAGLWRESARRSWGGGTGVDSRRCAASFTAAVLDWDEAMAFGSTLSGCDGHSHATLRLGSELPYRLAAVSAALPISSLGRRSSPAVTRWRVDVHGLPSLDGVVMWIGVIFDGRGAVEATGAPRRLRRCACTRAVPHEPGCAAQGETVRDALLPFVCASGRGGIIERFARSHWQLAALGSTGWVWGARLGGALVRGMSGFRQGDTVDVALDLKARSLSFSVNGGPWVTAVRQLYCARSTPQPLLFYPIVHLTDISRPRDGDLPVVARVRAGVGAGSGSGSD